MLPTALIGVPELSETQLSSDQSNQSNKSLIWASTYMCGAILWSAILAAFVGLGGVGPSNSLFFTMLLTVIVMLYTTFRMFFISFPERTKKASSFLFILLGNAFLTISIVYCTLKT